jgi:hypothetical protein
VPLLGASRLVANELPFGPDRAPAPDDDYAFGRIELPLDRLAPLVAGADMLVPPDGISVGLKRLDQRQYATPVLGLVRDEHVGHQAG